MNHNIFYLWHNFLRGKALIQEGSIWRIGDGRRIDVWKDKWVQSLPSYCPRFEGIQQLTPMKVDKLLVDGRRAWNEQMVREMFEPEAV